jgi:hypothetical protein
MAIRRRFIDWILMVQLAAALAIFAAIPGTAAQRGTISPRCAAHDLGAIDVIERLSRLADPPNTWLAEAGLDLVQARTDCLAGDEERAVALYQAIVSGALIWGYGIAQEGE